MEKINIRNIYRSNNGITLVALIITIILLLILAGVTINLTLGEGGLFQTAKLAVKNYTDAQNQERNYIDNLDNTIKNIIGGNKTPSKPTLVSQITPSDYGKTINYSVTVKNNNNENVTLNDWKVFYNDGNNVYIIMSECIDSSLFPTNSGLIAGSSSVGYEYAVGFSSGTSSTDAEALLQNEQIWSGFAGGRGALNAIGSPTTEMFEASWNANPKTSGTQIDFANLTQYRVFSLSDSTGLYVLANPSVGAVGRILFGK